MQLANAMTSAPTMGSLTLIKVEHTINFIEAVKRHQAIYDTTHQDYKNVEEKTKAWRSIAREIGINVEAAKRKWKNLRDSYTKYLRSFRVGTKTSRKYQYWAHAEHMDFLRPFQGPGRSSNSIKLDTSSRSGFYNGNDEEVGCDLGFEMVDKCYQDETISEEIVAKTLEYSSNGSGLAGTFNRRTVAALSEVDATTMFFLSLAKIVKGMPRQKQSAIKMMCMKVVHEAEMEVDNSVSEGESFGSPEIISSDELSSRLHNGPGIDNQGVDKLPIVSCSRIPQIPPNSETNPEHFLYVMSPSRVETMIDISSDDEAPKS